MDQRTLKLSGFFVVAVLLLATSSANAAFWQPSAAGQRIEDSINSRLFSASDEELRRFLDRIPNELSGQSLEIELPMPDGSLATFGIIESSIMEPELAAKFPHIRSFVVRGIDYPGSTGRVDISQKGFRGMIFTPQGRVFIDPVEAGSDLYAARAAQGIKNNRNHFQCDAYSLEGNRQQSKQPARSPVTANRVSGKVLGYRLAVSATPEYVAAVSSSEPSLGDAMAEINTAINRVNQIYERDLGIRLFLIGDNDRLIDVNGEAGFSNAAPQFLISENQAWIGSQIKASSYDVGHVFATGSGGLAQIGSVCGSLKAQGVSGLAAPTGDIFYIDFIAHEIGHQFGANHTFNGSTLSCDGNRWPPTAFEPGGGSTIMSYAGICGGEDLQLQSEATFHAGSIEEINAFVSNSSTGGSCASVLDFTPANNDPTGANAGLDRTIPAGTAFSLLGSATDADGDGLSYQWDQLDVGATATTALTFDSDQGDNPLFRSYVPQSVAQRHFPTLENQFGLRADAGEILPTTSRQLNFRLTVRDCRTGQATDDVRLTVDATSGPFLVTSHNAEIEFPGTVMQTVRWNVAGTTNAQVNCQNVDIDLLAFSSDKSTFGITPLLTAIPNNGLAEVRVGDNRADIARFRVSCSDNIFYDISDADLRITGAITLPTDGNTVALSDAGTCADLNVTGSPSGLSGSSDSGGGGSLQWWFLLWIVVTGLIGTRYGRYRVRVYRRSL